MSQGFAVRDVLAEIAASAKQHRDERWNEAGAATQQELADLWDALHVLTRIVKEMRDQ